MHEQHKFNKEIEIIKKSQTNSGAEKYITEMKKSMESFNSRLDHSEKKKKVSKPEYKSFEMRKLEEQKKKE